MKNFIYHTLRILALLVVLLLGSIPLLIAFVVGLALRRAWVAYAVAVALTVGITLLSFWYPVTFRFGSIDLKIHDAIVLAGVPSLAATMVKNVAFAYLGVVTGMAAREGYRNAKMNKGSHESN